MRILRRRSGCRTITGAIWTALHDCLTDLSRDVWIVLINGDLMDAALGDYAEKLRLVFTEATNLPYSARFTEHLS